MARFMKGNHILLPQMVVRKFWLRRALRGYPLYDPPHKVEERLLSEELAANNFAYFMRVRLDRMAYFQDWLRRYFLVTLTPDTKGVRALSRWGNKYARLLLNVGPTGHPTDSYFTSDRSPHTLLSQSSGQREGVECTVWRTQVIARLSRREVAHGANQSISADLSSRGFVSRIARIVFTKTKHSAYGIKSVATQLKSTNVVCAAQGISFVGHSGPVDPVQARVSDDDAFTEEYAEIEDYIEAQEISAPGHQMPEEDLCRLGFAQVCYERAAIAGQPGRDRSKAPFFQIHGYAEFCEESLERVQALVSMLHEITEIFSTASREFSCFLIRQMLGAIRPLSVERFTGGIIDERLRHAASFIDQMARFLVQPAEHINLRDRRMRL